MTSRYDIMYFVGVSTASSRIMQVFPDWSASLGLEARIVGLDLPLDAPPSVYSVALERIMLEDRARGALVTSHKAAMYEHARNLFSELDKFAVLCREVSCITRADGALRGSAKDPISARRAVEDILGPGHWARSHSHVL